MNTTELKELLDTTHMTLCLLSSTKGVEYSNSDDRLANFKRYGVRLRMSPEQALMVLFSKHLDAIESYVHNIDRMPVVSEPIEERIDDAILYLILLKGLIQERGRVPIDVPESSQMESGPDAASQRRGEKKHPGPVVLGLRDLWLDRGKVVIKDPPTGLDSL